MTSATRSVLFFFALFSITPLSAQTDIPDAHAPTGVMGDHQHHAGEFMFSCRHMHMRMAGNLSGSDSLSPEQIVTTVPNRVANPHVMPPMFRVVPESMDTGMQLKESPVLIVRRC